MIKRLEYIADLERYRGKTGLIKAITGVRRCGKSTLLQLFREKLVKEKIPSSRIININLESIENEELRNGRNLFKYVKEKIKTSQLYYVFIDEVQLADGYQEAVNSLRLLKKVDLYVTGSNSNLLSGELAARWAGRYIEIKMLPLSFREYAGVFPKAGANPDIIFKNYIEQGSFPEILTFKDQLGIRNYMEAIYNSIMIKDVMLQHGVKEAALLERVIKCLFSNIGSETSVNSMVNMLNNDMKLRSSEKKVYSTLLEAYIEGLLKSYVFYKAERYYVKGREYLRANAKYYAVDTGLRYYLLGNKGADSGHILENIVYLELLRRGNRVYIGKVAEKEVDFIAEGPGGIEYYQVAETLRGKETLARELAPLNAIPDHNPKFLLTRDYEPDTSHKGIKQLNALEWLLGH